MADRTPPGDDREDLTLAGIDLTAWQSPPAPDLADAVIALLRAPQPAAAIEPVDPPRRRAIGAAALAAAAILGAAAWGLGRGPRDGGGVVVAGAPRHLDLDGVTADLDAGAHVHWTRAGRTVTAHQAQGTARWAVADDDHLTLEGGGPGATVEASGASLRVEASMNLSDARLLGASAATAAAVAALTVVVYSGHVKATSGGQTVTIAPGGIVQLVAGQPPAPPAPPIAREPRTVGVAPVSPAPATAPRSPVIVGAAVLTRIAGEKQIPPDDDDRAAIARAGVEVTATFKLCIDELGAVAEVDRLRSTEHGGYDAKLERELRTWRYEPHLVDGVATPACTAVSFVYKPTAKPPLVTAGAHPAKCDPASLDELMGQARNQYEQGMAALALATVERALLCRQTVTMYRLAGMYACGAHNAASARSYYARIRPEHQPAIQMRCQLEGIPLP
jgi:hypothetical protein